MYMMIITMTIAGFISADKRITYIGGFNSYQACAKASDEYKNANKSSVLSGTKVTTICIKQ